MVDVLYYKMTRKEPNQLTITEMSSQSVNVT